MDILSGYPRIGAKARTLKFAVEAFWKATKPEAECKPWPRISAAKTGLPKKPLVPICCR